ncbi:hypothetical protein HOC13_00395 [Candidatus Woesearchaeota archaeon]|nr:hypothetical protein [Candidatus Woesearchaeota archaeon]
MCTDADNDGYCKEKTCLPSKTIKFPEEEYSTGNTLCVDYGGCASAKKTTTIPMRNEDVETDIIVSCGSTLKPTTSYPAIISYTAICKDSLPGGDCDDVNVQINSEATESCDQIDNNCNGFVDESPSCLPADCSTNAEFTYCSSEGGDKYCIWSYNPKYPGNPRKGCCAETSCVDSEGNCYSQYETFGTQWICENGNDWVECKSETTNGQLGDYTCDGTSWTETGEQSANGEGTLGDVTGDTCVTIEDIAILAESIEKNYVEVCTAENSDENLTASDGDVNEDGCVTIEDIAILAESIEKNYVETCNKQN